MGRRVIINKKLGLKGAATDTAELDELTYLLESGSDRIGALDFQRSPTEYVPRAANNAGMEELIESAERVEKGVPLTPDLDQALFHGSSIGGTRPKALIQDQGRKYVAKFSSGTDLKALFFAMSNTDNHNSAGFFSVADNVFTRTKAQHLIPVIHQVLDWHASFGVVLQGLHAFNDAFGGTLRCNGVFRLDKVSEAIDILGCPRQPDYFTGHGFS